MRVSDFTMGDNSIGLSDRAGSSSSCMTSSYCDNKWEGYTQALLDKPSVARFAIHSTKNYRKWTSTPGFDIKKEEIDAILTGFTDEQMLRLEGIKLAGQTFTFTRLGVNRAMMFGRCASTGFGCVLYPCHTCVLVATHEEGPQTNLCCNAIEKLGDFLTENGF